MHAYVHWVCDVIISGMDPAQNFWGGADRTVARGGHLASEASPLPGVWGWSPQRGPGAEPLARGLGGQSPPEKFSEKLVKKTYFNNRET